MDSGDSLKSEKSRICPSCRMQISVLAVKCRFCGEEVGKPKEEQRILSINDLGGEAIHHRAPSGSVMEALEAFRVESGLEGDGSGPAAQEGDGGALPEDAAPMLEDDTFGVEFGSNQKSAITSVYEKKPPTFQERFKVIGFIVVGITVLVFVGAQLPGWIDAYRGDADAEVTTFVDEGPRILIEGGPPIDALEASVKAIRFEDSAPHRKGAEDALSALIDEVHGLLNATPFDLLNLRKASMLSTRARDLYPSERSVDLAEEVKADTTAYKMILINIDRETKIGTFQLNKPGSPPIDVKQDDILAGRFRVRLVRTNDIVLEDQLRGNRTASSKLGGSPE